MKLEAYGIDPKTFYHTKLPLTYEENVFLGFLWVDHVGANSAISAKHLAWLLNRKIGLTGNMDQWKREVRHMQNHLLFDHNVPVLSRAGIQGGYYIAETDSEGREFYSTFRKRGLTSLVKASRGKQAAMVDMITQLSFEFEDMVDKTMPGHVKTASEVPAPIEVVDAFLKKMLADPEKFAGGLKTIGEKYGSVLMPKGRFDAMIAAMKSKTAEMQKIISTLEV
ncbi:MAG: hypothetical protein SV375_05215 [Thermodesulfobacteriota bacterium]|nr:hypothetical protein [Thermodesulfobacteriota bacterium]